MPHEVGLILSTEDCRVLDAATRGVEGWQSLDPDGRRRFDEIILDLRACTSTSLTVRV